jgi:hypothetical protein
MRGASPVPFSKQWLAFEPEAVKAMTIAFDQVIKGRGVEDNADAFGYLVAKKIIEIARHGEYNPVRLAELALKDLKR